MIRLFYNYFSHADAGRRAEIDQCLAAACANSSFDEIHILGESPPPMRDPRVRYLPQQSRPVFQTFFDAIAAVAGATDISVVLNSDCFVDMRDMSFLETIEPDEAWCLFRTEVKSASPIRTYLFRNLRGRRKHLHDQQDGWVIRGVPRAGMTLDFPMGMPGCDNRLAAEMSGVGYRIRCPLAGLRLYHLHATRQRPYGAGDRVPGPYAFPQPF